jgi:hypothetical protein
VSVPGLGVTDIKPTKSCDIISQQMATFSFGAPPAENPDDDRDEKDKKIEELERQLSRMKLQVKDLKRAKRETEMKLQQTEAILVNVQAPTVFNQLQVNDITSKLSMFFF